MRKDRLDIKLRDSVYEPGSSGGTIQFDDSLEDRTRYRVWLYVDGPDVPYVRSVSYRLHPTFPDPVRMVRRTPSNPNCALPIWTWGLFEVEAEVEEKSGRTYTLRHQLRYDRELTPNAQYEQVELES